MTSYRVMVPSKVRALIKQETGVSAPFTIKYDVGRALAGLATRTANVTPAGTVFGVDALTADFLGGGGYIAPPAVKAGVVLTPVKGATVQQLAQRTSRANIQYQLDRGADQSASMKAQAVKGAWSKAGIDWGLIPMGAKVIATGAAVVASGGAAGAALAGGLTTASAIAAGTAAAAGVASAKSITEGAKNVEVFKVLDSEIGAPILSTADKILGDPAVQNAREIIENTQAAAALGDKQAELGASILGAVAQLRQSLGLGPGQPAIQPQGGEAEILMRTNVASTTGEIRALAQSVLDDYKNWFSRLKDWIRKAI